jgi:hypothetical protein
MSTIKLKPDQWENIRLSIANDHGIGILLISWATVRELGFKVRNYRYRKSSNYSEYGEYVHEIHLDFDDETKATYFRLKYL